MSYPKEKNGPSLQFFQFTIYINSLNLLTASSGICFRCLAKAAKNWIEPGMDATDVPAEARQ